MKSKHLVRTCVHRALTIWFSGTWIFDRLAILPYCINSIYQDMSVPCNPDVRGENQPRIFVSQIIFPWTKYWYKLIDASKQIDISYQLSFSENKHIVNNWFDLFATGYSRTSIKTKSIDHFFIANAIIE